MDVSRQREDEIGLVLGVVVDGRAEPIPLHRNPGRAPMTPLFAGYVPICLVKTNSTNCRREPVLTLRGPAVTLTQSGQTYRATRIPDRIGKPRCMDITAFQG